MLYLEVYLISKHPKKEYCKEEQEGSLTYRKKYTERIDLSIYYDYFV